MSSRLFIHQSDNETPVEDLILEKNGRYVQFANELTEHILRKRTAEKTFGLHQTVAVIDYENIADSTGITSGVSKTLKESIINWNIITFEGDDEQDMPEIFKKIKPSTVIGAAEKSGIIQRSKKGGILQHMLFVVAGFLITGMIHLYNAGKPLSPVMLFEVVKNGWSNWNFVGPATATGITVSIILSVIRSYLKNRNPRLYHRIKEHLRTGDEAGTYDPAFVTAIKDRFLQLPFPLAILVTKPRRLDLFSKQVLCNILSDEECGTIGQIFWVIGAHDGTTRPDICSSAEIALRPKKVDYRYRYISCMPRGKTTSKKPLPRAA